jgi:hypothetical protein
MGLFGRGPAVVALTTGLPLPTISATIVSRRLDHSSKSSLASTIRIGPLGAAIVCNRA